MFPSCYAADLLAENVALKRRVEAMERAAQEIRAYADAAYPAAMRATAGRPNYAAYQAAGEGCAARKILEAKGTDA